TGSFTDQVGGALVYPGSAAGLSVTAAWTSESAQVDAQLGTSVSAGDLDGDGYSDVIVGVPGFDGDCEEDEGQALAYLGSAAGVDPSPAWTAESDSAGAAFGSSVASVGDVDDDGFDDVAIGAPLYSAAVPEQGRAYLYRGAASGLEAQPAWTLVSKEPYA